MKFKMNLFLFVMATILVSSNIAANPQGLKEAFEGKFLIGAALGSQHIQDPDSRLLKMISREFNTLTGENVMKWESLQPKPGQYDFELADKLVSISQKNNITLIGHALIWHQQTPDWVFADGQGNLVTRAVLLQRMQSHISAVLSHFKGKVAAWDVVNEALNDDGSMRQSKWQQIIGDDFVLKAFEYARQADPDILLYYNDYSLVKPEKRAAAVALIKMLQQHGAQIDGIGIQGHFALGYPALGDLENSINAFARLGVEVMITELDVSVLPFPNQAEQGADISQDFALNEKFNPYSGGLPQSVEDKLNRTYSNLFKLFVKHQNTISRVTFWGVDDQHSWRNNWPMRGRTDYPLLFDRSSKPKPAYWAVRKMTPKE